MSANATRQRKQPLGATDSDGVDHDKPASEPQGKAIKKQSFNQCTCPYLFLPFLSSWSLWVSVLTLPLRLTVTGKLILAAIALSSFYIWSARPRNLSSRLEERC